MFTLQGLMMKSEAIMEQIRINAIEYTFEQFKVATRHYYETSEGGDIAVKLIHKLEELGANMEVVFDTDLDIRDEVEAEQKEAGQ